VTGIDGCARPEAPARSAHAAERPVTAADAMRARARSGRAGGAGALVGLIGQGIQRSLTPALHMAEARAQGLALDYQLIDLDLSGDGPRELPALLQVARQEAFAGLNITFPCKQAVIPSLDELSADARAMGAVTTVVFRDGRTIGHNTDASGWRWGFERTLPRAKLERVVLLGGGGAGSAIAHALLAMGVQELVIVDRERDKSQTLATSLRGQQPQARVHAEADVAVALRGASGLVHATPTGMDKLPGLPLPVELLHGGLWLSEIVYFPLETELVRAARGRGMAVVDGGTMAVGQALGAFELFTGLKADAARMDACFRRLVAQQRCEAPLR
jgi:shikimate dehydrogenase